MSSETGLSDQTCPVVTGGRQTHVMRLGRREVRGPWHQTSLGRVPEGVSGSWHLSITPTSTTSIRVTRPVQSRPRQRPLPGPSAGPEQPQHGAGAHRPGVGGDVGVRGAASRSRSRVSLFVPRGPCTWQRSTIKTVMFPSSRSRGRGRYYLLIKQSW